MDEQISITGPCARRGFLAGMGAGGALLLLPGCQSMGGFSLVDAIRRLLSRSSQNAFARLTAPGGFYDNSLARLELPAMLGSRGDILSDILVSAVFKKRLQKSFNRVAERGAERAAPLVTDAVRMVGIENAAALIKGGPMGATQFLRGSMGMSLVEAMVPSLGGALKLADDPIVGQALARLTGADMTGMVRGFAGDVDNAIWGEIGREEAAIRANPAATNDPVLIGVFGAS